MNSTLPDLNSTHNKWWWNKRTDIATTYLQKCGWKSGNTDYNIQ